MTAAEAARLRASVDVERTNDGAGTVGYVDLTLDGEHVGGVAVFRPVGVRRFECGGHDAIPALHLDADVMAGETGGTAGVLARRLLRRVRSAVADGVVVVEAEADPTPVDRGRPPTCAAGTCFAAACWCAR